MSLIAQVHSLHASITTEQRGLLSCALGEKSWAAFNAAVAADHQGDDDDCLLALIRFGSTLDDDRLQEFRGFLTDEQQSMVDGILNYITKAMEV